MTPAVNHLTEKSIENRVSWLNLLWFGSLLIACYAPVLLRLVRQWSSDDDMGHGFFVPIIAGVVAWQKREQLLVLRPSPNRWGLLIVAWAAVQLYLGAMAAELFLQRTAFVISIIGIVLLLCGAAYLRILAFPIFLLFFMIPIPEILYNQITFPLQIIASKAAWKALMLLHIPVLREGNILELAEKRLDVVEACSGIRSLLSLTFLSLVYGYFFEKKNWVRVLLFLSTIPIAIIANACRVTLTGVLTDKMPEYAEGFFHTAQGWVLFMVALVMLMAFHQIVVRTYRILHARF